MPRGGSLNVPTVSDKELGKAPALPPSRRARRADQSATGTTERVPRERSGFLPFLAAILMAAGLLAVVAYEVQAYLATNTLGSKKEPDAQTDSPAPAPGEHSGAGLHAATICACARDG